MVVFPNIKINLGLHILRKRTDGYRDIETVMVPVDWCDVLEIVPFEGPDSADRLTLSGLPVGCEPDKNLVTKALVALRNAGLTIAPVEMFLHKNVPDGAGLGGGSSDAAFALRLLNELLSLGISETELARIASTIGCDCPFFIYNRPMLATGRGEKLRPIGGLYERLKNKIIVVIKDPAVSVSTAAAYSLTTPDDNRRALTEIINLPLDDWKNLLVNDFEQSVFAQTPVPGRIKTKLYELGAEYAAMSGSGSAVFGIFEPDSVESSEIQQHFKHCKIHFGHICH